MKFILCGNLLLSRVQPQHLHGFVEILQIIFLWSFEEKKLIKENISIKRSIFLNQPLGELSLPSDRSQSFWKENIRHCLSNSSWFELFADGQKNVQLRNNCTTWTQRWHPRVPDPWAGLDCWSCSCRRAPSSDLTSMRLLLKFLSFVKRNSSDSCKKSTVICYFLHVSHVLSLDDEKKAKLVVSDNNFWFSMNSGMTRTLGRKEGRLACLCTIWCNCAQLLHPRWCSGNQC